MTYEKMLSRLGNDRESGAADKPSALEMQITFSLAPVYDCTGVESESATDVEIEFRNLLQSLAISPQPIYVGSLAFEVKAISHSAGCVVLHGRTKPRVEY